MKLAELVNKLAAIPDEYSDYEVSCELSDFELELPIKDVSRLIRVEEGNILITIKR